MSAEVGREGRPDGSSFGASVLRGGAWQSVSRILAQAYTIVVSIVAARYLGAAGMGRLVFITFAYMTLVTLVTAGVPIALNRFSAEAMGSGRAGAIRALYRWARRIEAGGAALVTGILVSVAMLGAEPRGAWLAAAVASAAAVLQTLPNAILLGTQRWREASVIGLVTGAVGGAAKLGLLWVGEGIVALVVVDACVVVVNLVVASFYARGALPRAPAEAESSADLIARARRYALASSVGVVLTIVVLQRSEVLFLQRYADDVQIALYSIPFSALEALNLVPAALALAAASVFATLFGAGAFDRIRTGFGLACRLTLVTTLPMAAAALVLGPTGLVLAYGDDYVDTAPVLRILALSFPAVSIMFISGAVVQGFGVQRAPLLILGFAAAVNLTLDVVLIPKYGAIGAAIASAVGQSANALPLLAYATSRVGGVDWELSALVRVVVASTLAGLASAAPIVWLAPLPGFLVGGSVFVVSFLLVAMAIGVISARDAVWLEHMVGPRFGGRARRVIRSCAMPGAAS